MHTVLIFAGAFLLSLTAAFSAGIQLTDYFNSTEEFIAVMMALILFAPAALAAFAVAYTLAHRVRVLAIVALALMALAVSLVGLPALAEAFARRSTNPFLTGSAQDRAIAAELLIPAAVMLSIQWALLRRRWLVAHSLEHRTAWPWITIIVAALIGLSRPGIDIIGSAIRPSATDWFAGLWLIVMLGAAVAVVVIGALEMYIRRRRLARAAAN